MKQKEKDFAKRLLSKAKAYKAGVALGEVVHDKQLAYYLDKWTDKGFWEFGVSMRSGWFTPEGIEELPKLIKANS